MAFSTFSLFLVLCFSLFFFSCQAQDPSYDHQTVTYNASIVPINITGTFTITPFFSPFTPIELETQLVLGATSSIDIGIPSVSSWNGCECSSGLSGGCTVYNAKYNESFPIFAALLNAIHSGVKVRILTNNYNSPCPNGLIDPLTFLSLAGAQVRYFTTTTFIHSKYMAADGKKAAVSSVNYSYTSFLENREAGFLIEGPDAKPILDFLTKTFELDFNQGGPWPAGKYSQSDMNIILDKTLIPIPIPKQRPINMYFPPLKSVTAKMEVEAIASPDFAFDSVASFVSQTKKSFALYIYQITDDAFCNIVLQASTNIPNFKLLVSRYIYSEADWKAATVCYTKLHAAGVPIYKTSKDFRYCHQKFWILDGENVFMSTGNWGDTDYPQGSMIFPPYSSGSSWRKTNRDFTIRVRNSNIVSQFQKVFDEDYAKGEPWVPA